MLNNVILVGRTVDEPKLVTLKDGVVVCNLTLAVVRPFKSQDTGEYETDFIPVVLWRGIAESVVEYCKKVLLLELKAA